MERLLVDSGFFWFALVPEVDISLGSWRGEAVVELVASAMRASENRRAGPGCSSRISAKKYCSAARASYSSGGPAVVNASRKSFTIHTNSRNG